MISEKNMSFFNHQSKVWLKAMRAPFFQAVIIPTILGTVIAWSQSDIFNLGYFLLTILGVIFINAGTNLANDYFDHKSRADDINEEVTPFSGGSRVIQEGLISPRRIYLVALLFLILGSLVGLFLTYTRGLTLLLIGIIGVFSGYFYTASPVKVGYRGLGEILAGLNCGPLVVLGAYYVQAQTLSLEALSASIPLGLMITAVLYINQFPDYKCDKKAEKGTLVVRMGPERAITGFYLLLILTYLSIIIAGILGIIPKICLISLLTLPLALKAIKVARKNYTNTKELIPAMSNTIVIHLTVGLLLSSGYVIKKILFIL